MEQEARELLRKRLDECLRAHADALNSNDIGSIYNIQQLVEVHLYLKTEHEFTAAEVEALLAFKDPLDVARWCWEENTHKHSFPICELLKEIHADDRFEPAERTSPLNEKYVELVKLLGRNLNDYKAKLLNLDKEALIDRAAEIAAATAAYGFMAEGYVPKMEEVDFLLRFDNPLQVIQDYWPSGELIGGEDMIQAMMDDLYYPPETRDERENAPKSIREKLQTAAREVQDRPASETARHDTGAR